MIWPSALPMVARPVDNVVGRLDEQSVVVPGAATLDIMQSRP
ncbi:hypothetical protein [Streptomyces sp. SAS_275]